MKEKDIQVVFRDHNQIEGVFELKLCKGASLPFDAVKEHQVHALRLISDSGLFYKIPDSAIFTGSATRFAGLKPFDCFFLSHEPAYVVICFYMPRQYKKFYYIPIATWIEEDQMNPRKSITMERAAEIAAHRLEV